MKKLEKNTKLLLIALAIIIPMVSLAVIFLPPSLTSDNNPAAQYYNLNQEITAFPTANTSLTFKSWTYTSTFDIFEADENTNLVILNFTLKNTANNEINIRSNLQYSTEAAPYTPREAPLLKYSDHYAEAKTEIPYAHYWRLWQPQTNLTPNESINGCIIYEIPKEQTPTELVYPNKESPKIIITLQ
ncbi:MAG TPA: hypothetical protein VGB11_06770 [Candidatus Bathyarchaeia archaeon]